HGRTWAATTGAAGLRAVRWTCRCLSGECPMPKRQSIAEVRADLPRLVHAVEKGRPLEITRRGQVVAVLMSARDYHRLVPERPDFWEAVTAFRERVDLARLGFSDADFEGLRDRSPGREVML